MGQDEYIRGVDMAFRYSYAMCYGLAKECAYAAEFRRKNGSAYNAACRNGWIKDFTWFVDGHKLGLNGKWTDATCTSEAQKYRRKVDFQKGASGAYRYAAAHGLLEKFDWFERCEINLEFGRIYSVYRYVFTIDGEKYVYIGLTLRPRIRDERHRKGDSSVYDFARLHGVPIPPMEVIQSKLTQLEARDKEDFFRHLYEAAGDHVLNRAKTGRMIGSVGGMHRKWTRVKCEEEAKKYKTRGEFQHKSPTVYQTAYEHGWLNDYVWMRPVRHGKWTREAFLQEAKKYTSKKAFASECMGAYIAGRLNGWLGLCTWFVPGRGWTEGKSRVRKLGRCVCQFDHAGKVVAEYKNLTAATRATGILNIHKCLSGERKLAGGFGWAYSSGK